MTNTTIAPTKGALAIAGRTVLCGFKITPANAGLALGGIAGHLDTKSAPSLYALGISGIADGLDTKTGPPLAGLNAAGQIAGSGQAVMGTASYLTLIGGVAQISSGSPSIAPLAGSLVFTGSAPIVGIGAILSPANGYLAVIGVPIDPDTQINPGACVLTLHEGTAMANTTIAPGAGAVTQTGVADSINSGTVAHTIAAALLLLGGTANLGLWLAPAAAALAIAGVSLTYVDALAPPPYALAISGDQAIVWGQPKSNVPSCAIIGGALDLKLSSVAISAMLPNAPTLGGQAITLYNMGQADCWFAFTQFQSQGLALTPLTGIILKAGMALTAWNGINYWLGAVCASGDTTELIAYSATSKVELQV